MKKTKTKSPIKRILRFMRENFWWVFLLVTFFADNFNWIYFCFGIGLILCLTDSDFYKRERIIPMLIFVGIPLSAYFFSDTVTLDAATYLFIPLFIGCIIFVNYLTIKEFFAFWNYQPEKIEEVKIPDFPSQPVIFRQ